MRTFFRAVLPVVLMLSIVALFNPSDSKDAQSAGLPQAGSAPSQTENGVVPEPHLGLQDISRMHETYNRNQARFFRDFKGKKFAAKMRLESVTEAFMTKGSFDVAFKAPKSHAFLADVSCYIGDDDDVKFITDQDKGAALEVSGTVDDHTMGVIELTECKIRK